MKLKIVHNEIFYRSFGNVPNEYISFGSVPDVCKGVHYGNYEGFRWH